MYSTCIACNRALGRNEVVEEAIEACERMFRDTRVRVSSDRIAEPLARLRGG